MVVEFTTNMEEVHSYTKEYAKKFDGQVLADAAKAMTLDIYAATSCMAAAGLENMLSDIVSNMGNLVGQAILARTLSDSSATQATGVPPTNALQ